MKGFLVSGFGFQVVGRGFALHLKLETRNRKLPPMQRATSQMQPIGAKFDAKGAKGYIAGFSCDHEARPRSTEALFDRLKAGRSNRRRHEFDVDNKIDLRRFPPAARLSAIAPGVARSRAGP